MKILRRIHLYLGCFFAPLLLFFVCTGWYQIFHERKKNPGEGERWVDRLSDVHVDQIFVNETASSFSPKLFQFLVVLMSISLILTVLLGIVLAFRSIRQRWLVWASLGLGVLVPVLFLWLGQRR